MKTQSTKPNTSNITFALTAIEVSEYSFLTPEEPIQGEPKFFLEIFMAQRFSLQDKIVVNNCTVIIFLDEKKDKQLCKLTTKILFQVENLSDFIITSTDGKMKLKNECVFPLNSVTISTVRGILFMKNAGTYLNGTIIPIMDVTKMQPKQVEPND
mgnify:CR=1 FL=1